MNATTILEVRKCPSKNYAIAYWIFNNHNDEFRKNGIQKFMENYELSLLNPDWDCISVDIRGFELDDEYDSCDVCDDWCDEWFDRNDCGCKILCKRCVKDHDQDCEDYINLQSKAPSLEAE
jgi:hypothetical protein